MEPKTAVQIKTSVLLRPVAFSSVPLTLSRLNVRSTEGASTCLCSTAFGEKSDIPLPTAISAETRGTTFPSFLRSGGPAYEEVTVHRLPPARDLSLYNLKPSSSECRSDHTYMQEKRNGRESGNGCRHNLLVCCSVEA
ncbi:hypothetical protein RJT34_18604 [Clitoria ternatea]|uniref:Uncharacterized protein n=1 Tax=Clitoria ternatea TaxID=43366 RepID=A0AAN9JDD0_CLITE